MTTATVEFKYWGATAYIDARAQWTANVKGVAALLTQTCEREGPGGESPDLVHDYAYFVAEKFDGEVTQIDTPDETPLPKGQDPPVH